MILWSLSSNHNIHAVMVREDDDDPEEMHPRRWTAYFLNVQKVLYVFTDEIVSIVSDGT